jgi:hypothetical protein
MTIFWPSETDRISVIDGIRDAIGRDITIMVTVSGIACPACSLNPVSNLSTNPFCPTCGGAYWLNTTSGYIVNAHVSIGEIDLPWRVAGGYIEKGEALVQIKYTATGLYAVQHAVHYIVDGKVYLQDDISYRGVPEINRMVITLKEQTG